MTTNANAPVEHKHLDDAAKMLGFRGCHQVIADYPSKHEIVRQSVTFHAQTLANLEAANNRLAEIEKINIDHCRSVNTLLLENAKLEALASGHTPSPCPECAAKDEAMGAFRRDVSEAIVEYADCPFVNFPAAKAALRRFIIPPADPVAETVREIVEGIWQNGTPSRDDLIRHVSAELKSRLPLGGV